MSSSKSMSLPKSNDNTKKWIGSSWIMGGFGENYGIRMWNITLMITETPFGQQINELYHKTSIN